MVTGLVSMNRVLGHCSKAAAHYGCSLPSVFLRLVRLKYRDGFRPKESFLWGLADPSSTTEEIRACVSRRRLFGLQERFNPRAEAFRTEEKAVFYQQCADMGIPVPRTHAVIQVHEDPRGDSPEQGSLPRIIGRDACREYLLRTAPETFVIKPSRGVYARGLQVLTRGPQGRDFRDPGGRTHTCDGIIAAMTTDQRYGTFVVQERLENHESLKRLAGSDALQTVRIVTMVPTGSQARILFACTKIMNSDHASDNFDYGVSGNLLADVNLDTGTLSRVVGRHHSGFGLQEHPEHPATGVPFDGFALPDWDEACGVALTAAQKFLPLRTIGWDIALTGSGPVVIEGNVWWDALHNAHGKMPEFLAYFDDGDRDRVS